MGADVGALAETARRAGEVGAPLVDLNFGCPAKGAIAGCAGSAILREPKALESIVSACARAAGVPVTAKIRAGYDDDRLLEDLARAAEAGGAAMLTVHCRTRAEAYQDEVDWSRIARAVAVVSIPVCGNGGISGHGDFERMRKETGCALAMVGRGALADPWIFRGDAVTAEEAAAFLLEYAARLLEGRPASPGGAISPRAAISPRGAISHRGAAGRVKQLLRYWTAGGLVDSDRESWMREADPERLFARLRSVRKKKLACAPGRGFGT
jgi:tRNA-dihydrouridine synthase